MKSTINFYQRVFTGIGIVSSLLFLGACQRPRNPVVAQFQAKSNAVLAQMVVDVRAARAFNPTAARSAVRGTTNNLDLSQLIGGGYSADVYNDTQGCLQEANLYPKEYKYYYAMVSKLVRCLQRQTVNAAAPLYGNVFPFLGEEGQAYLRYLVDPNNGTGQFDYNSYGFGYQWGLGHMPIGQFNNDPLRMWNVLGGNGNGFY